MFAKGFGGAERYYIDLATALAKRGHDVLAISHKGSVSEEILEGTREIKQESVSLLGKWDPFVAGKVRDAISIHKSELVQAHLARGAFIAGKVTSNLKIPLVVHTHNFVNLKYYKHVNKFIPCTNAQREYLINNDVAQKKIKLIRNFSAFIPVNEVTCNSEVRKIVAHGRFVHKKGFDLLLNSFATIPGDIELFVAGDGPEREATIQLASRLNLQDRVHFPGWQDDIQSFLKTGDLFVLPSRDEPFGIALLEAMACGVPMVSTLCHGPLEILDESVAYLCEVDNEESLRQSLKTAIVDQNGRQAKAQAALTLYKEHYYIDKAVAQFEDLYKQTLEENS